ncbi:MAG: hypothetical protein ACEQR8_02090 [Cypionkella sp.]
MSISARAVAAVLMVAAGPAAAQYMPHLDPNIYMLTTMNYGAGANPCMAGTPMADAKVLEARGPALAAMQEYFSAARGGGAKSAAFHLDKKTRWTGGGAVAGAAEIDAQADPLAAAGLALEAEPLRFYRGSTGATALGQWAVLGEGGRVAGVYTGFFVRQNKLWKLRELTVSGAEETVAPIAQYCIKPGDVIEHRLTATEAWRKNAQKSLDDARAKLAGAATAADPARERERWSKLVAKREKNLAEAVEAFDEARADAAEIERLTGKAHTAQAFRIVEKKTPAGRGG